MEYAHVSVKFPAELDAEIERLLDETGLYTNRSEFVRAACREHLERLHDDPAVAAVRVERLLARAEDSRVDDDELDERLAALRERVDDADAVDAVAGAREETTEPSG